MNNDNKESMAIREVRPDFISKERYFSREFAALENQHLWLQVWQWACREEDIPKVGDYVVYDVAGQSLIVIRTAETVIKAFHNVCPHRGRRLLSGKGHITKFHCIFHAWQWDLDGNSTRILDQEQWHGCPGITPEELKLSAVHVDTWGGFVFISMAENPEPLEKFLAPANTDLAPLKLEQMRYCWHLEIEVESNWKVAQEAFMESYHVWGTHPQLLPFVDERNISEAKGKHGRHIYFYELPPGTPSRRLGEFNYDLNQLRESFSNFIGALGKQVGNPEWNGQMTRRSIDAAQQTLASLPDDTPIYDAAGAAMMAMKSAADADDAYFPLLSPEETAQVGSDWNLFPTLSIVPAFDGALIFRALPRGDDPNKCTLEMISLLHWGKGKEPKVEKQHLDDWRSQHKDLIPPLLVQDLINMEDVQKGMHSIGLKAMRPNPVQEVQVSHFHKVINQYLFAEEADNV